jgi:hypothetical protein
MTALFDLGRATEKSFWFSSFDTFNFTSHAQAFGREPNAWFDRDSPWLIWQNAETPVAVDFYSSLLIAIDRASRARHRIVEWPNFLSMSATHWMTKELAPRGGFEPPTFRLTANRVL